MLSSGLLQPRAARSPSVVLWGILARLLRDEPLDDPVDRLRPALGPRTAFLGRWLLRITIDSPVSGGSFAVRAHNRITAQEPFDDSIDRLRPALGPHTAFLGWWFLGVAVDRPSTSGHSRYYCLRGVKRSAETTSTRTLGATLSSWSLSSSLSIESVTHTPLSIIRAIRPRYRNERGFRIRSNICRPHGENRHRQTPFFR